MDSGGSDDGGGSGDGDGNDGKIDKTDGFFSGMAGFHVGWYEDGFCSDSSFACV